MRDGPCSLVTHVLPPSSYRCRRSILVTWPIHGHVSQLSNRATRRPHGARCDEPPRRWLPRGTGCVRVARTRGRERLLHRRSSRCGFRLVQRCSAPALQYGALLFSPPTHPSLLFFPFLSFLFCGPLFFYSRESGSIFTARLFRYSPWWRSGSSLAASPLGPGFVSLGPHFTSTASDGVKTGRCFWLL